MGQKYILFSLFYALQIGVYLFYKFGSTSPSRWIPCFIAGNILGMICMWIMMKLYTVMNANVATGLTMGGGFLLGQIALAVVFRTGLTWQQYLGIMVASLGLFILAKG